MSRPVVQRSILVPEDLDIELKKLAAELRVDKTDLYELGAWVIKAIIEEGRIPDELGFILAKRNPTVLDRLSKILRAKTLRG